MEHQNAWKTYSDDELAKVDELAARYIDFISANKISARSPLPPSRRPKTPAMSLSTNSSRTAVISRRATRSGRTRTARPSILVHLGTDPLVNGLNILGAHIDSPRLDLKQNPLYESTDLAFLDTHYYGGIKKYQWVTLPLAIHGVIAKTDGTVVPVTVGEDTVRPRVRRHRFAHSPGARADEEGREQGRRGRGARPARRRQAALYSTRMPPKTPTETTTGPHRKSSPRKSPSRPTS